MRGRVEVLGLAAIALWAVVFWSGPLINDAGWQLWVGRQINGGARLYVDIMEVNPPLWFWIAAVVQRMSALTGIAGQQLLVLLFAAAAGVTVALCSRIVEDRRERALLYAGVAAALFVTSPYAHLQREQFVFIVTIPYVALIARRASGAAVSPGLAIATALFAATGLALKHYFALVPIALELWLIWKSRQVRVRPELVALGGAALLYAAAIALATPEYLTAMVPLIRLAYGGYDPPLFDNLNQPALLAAAFAIIAVVACRRNGSWLAEGLALATGAFAISYLIQSKGFHYQAVPALGMAIVAVLVAFGVFGRAALRQGGAVAALLALATSVAVPVAAGAPRDDHAAARAAADLPRGSTIFALTANGVTVWPLVEEKGLNWPSRHMTLWMLLAVWFNGQDGHSDGLVRLGQQVRFEAAEDIACSQPEMVLVDRHYDQFAPERDVLRFFMEEPRFAQAMRGYAEVEPVEYLRVFRRVGPPSPRCAAETGPA